MRGAVKFEEILRGGDPVYPAATHVLLNLLISVLLFFKVCPLDIPFIFVLENLALNFILCPNVE